MTSKDRRLDAIKAATRNTKWKSLFFGLAAISTLAYGTYRELANHQEELEAEDPLEALKNLSVKMQRARREPEEIFAYLAEGTKRAWAIEQVAGMATTGTRTWPNHPPLFRADEVPLIGGLWFQKIYLDTSPPGTPERSKTAQSGALVGGNHLIHIIDYLDPRHGDKIDAIVKRHPLGNTAIQARDRQFLI